MFDYPTGSFRPAMRGLLHGGALLLAVPATVVLLWRAEPARRVEAGVYAASLLLLLGVSAGYHRLTRSPRTQLVMSRLDHGAIFVLIAGTSTPIVLVAVPSPYSIILLSLVWGVGALAATVRVLRKLPRLFTSMYLVVGWLGALAVPWLVRYSPMVTAGVVLGGLCYTVGAVLFALHKPTGWPTVFGYHEFFHVFTLGGFVSHFLCVAAVVGVASHAG
ncbi:MAG: PAQR family membrane homeostasis protein TrhA [Actinomycetes bacterium]